jgi:hypothetical protein
MPHLPMDFNKTVMYKIVCRDINIEDCYVGHTTHFKSRKNQHKTCCNNFNSKKSEYPLYQFIRKNGGWENWDMIEIEKYPCEDVNEARKRERYWIETFTSSLNTYIPSRTELEYREENRDKLTLRSKQYRKDNLEICRKRERDYSNANKEKKSEYKKEWYDAKKEQILLKISTKYTCACGACLCIGGKSRHERTRDHISFIQSQQGCIEC